MNKEKKEHSSYGMISFSRTNGGNPSLFGSSVEHNEKITMRVSHGSVVRDLHREWYMPEKQVVEVEMSFTQFAEAITSMNTTGVPCTILYTEKDGNAQPCDFTVTREQFEDEFRENRIMANRRANELIDDLKESLSKGRMTKKEMQDCISKLHMLSMDINENTDFIYKQFNKQMDRTTLEAKNEIEAFVQHKVQSLGIEKLKELQDTASAVTQIGTRED